MEHTNPVVGTSRLGNLEQLGRLLADRRRSRGLSAREVAERSGISPTYLGAIERGRNAKTDKPSRPSADSLLALAAVLEMDAGELLELAEYSPSLATRGRVQGDSGLANRSPDMLARSVQESVRSFYRFTPFLMEVALERLDEFAREMKLVANGTFRCSADQEPHYSQLAIDRCQYSLKAISYQDLEWWTSDLGADYLDAHRKLESRGGHMTRVFIAPREEWVAYRETLAAHLEIGISTLISDLDPLTESAVRDFVIYDDALLRTASTVLADEKSPKTAEFTEREDLLDSARGDFDRLRRRAMEVDTALLERLEIEAEETRSNA